MVPIGWVTRVRSSGDWRASHRIVFCIIFQQNLCTVDPEPRKNEPVWNLDRRRSEIMKAKRRAMFRFDILDYIRRLGPMVERDMEFMDAHALRFFVGVVVLGRWFAVHVNPDFEAGD